LTEHMGGKRGGSGQHLGREIMWLEGSVRKKEAREATRIRRGVLQSERHGKRQQTVLR